MGFPENRHCNGEFFWNAYWHIRVLGSQTWGAWPEEGRIGQREKLSCHKEATQRVPPNPQRVPPGAPGWERTCRVSWIRVRRSAFASVPQSPMAVGSPSRKQCPTAEGDSQGGVWLRAQLWRGDPCRAPQRVLQLGDTFSWSLCSVGHPLRNASYGILLKMTSTCHPTKGESVLWALTSAIKVMQSWGLEFALLLF